MFDSFVKASKKCQKFVKNLGLISGNGSALRAVTESRTNISPVVSSIPQTDKLFNNGLRTTNDRKTGMKVFNLQVRK